ncbi:MAG: SpoVA/SpoVAEb family sporulation membrane protein [bacterium]|nr:SpoVA/SpoVAEb family sporulation membrane protein [bacterium]
MKKQEYLKVVEECTAKDKKLINYVNSFTVGGLIGFLGEGIKMICTNYYHLPVSEAISYVLVILIFISCLCTGLGFFDDIVSKFRCGIVIPITGFAHSIMSSALDYKNDGLITGVGANFFRLAGSVLLYGIVSGFICAVIKVIINV